MKGRLVTKAMSRPWHLLGATLQVHRAQQSVFEQGPGRAEQQAEGGGVRCWIASALNRLDYPRLPYSCCLWLLLCCPVTVSGTLAKNVGWRTVGGHELQYFLLASPTTYDYCCMHYGGREVMHHPRRGGMLSAQMLYTSG